MTAPSTRSTVRNVSINGTALLVCGLVNLFFLGYLATRLGIRDYGLIALARTLLATGVLTILDLGLSEAAGARTAALRATGDHGTLWSSALLAAAFAAVAGLVGGLIMILAAEPVASMLLRNDLEKVPEFAVIVIILAATLVVQLPGSVCESILRGLNRFRAYRSLEVGHAVAFAGIGVVLVERGHGYFAIIMLLIAIVILRALVAVTLIAVPMWRARSLLRLDRDEARKLFHLARNIFGGKLLGVVNLYSIYYASSILVGAAGLGLVDLLMRWPRFLKAFFGQLNSAIMPFAVGLDATKDREGLVQTYTTSLTFAMLVTVPALLSVAFFAEDLLLAWVGAEFARSWPWLSALFLWPLVVLPVSLGGMMLVSRPGFVARINVISAGQLIVILAVAVSTAGTLREYAFLLAHLAGVFAVVPFQVRLIERELGLRAWASAKISAKVVLGALTAVLAALGIHATNLVTGPITLAIAIGLCCLVAWAALGSLVLTAPERRQVRRIVLMFLRP